MKKIVAISFFLSFICMAADAQYGGYGRPRYQRVRQPRPQSRPVYARSNFEPYVSFSVGYGFPNLAKNQLMDFYNYYPGTVSQTGPITGSLDYQYSRFGSIGVMVGYGKVERPYFLPSNLTEMFRGKVENTAILLNLMHYMPASQAVNPYLRTAIGVNIWNSTYADAVGNKAFIANDDPTLAYQVSLGTKLRLGSNASFYVEAGYGRYIVNGGLSFKF